MSKNIDKLFKDKFKESKATAPTEAWPVIQAKLKMRRINRLIYTFSVLGFLGLISFILFYTQTEKTLSKPLLKNTSLKNEVILKDNDVNEIDSNKSNLPVSIPHEDSKKLYATIATKKESKNNMAPEKTTFFKKKFNKGYS